MGDRANVIIKQEDDSQVVFYTHWGGHNLPADLHRAISKKWRWDDDSYLTRIIFDEVNHEPKGETGIGISTHILDNEHNILIVKTKEQKVEMWNPAFNDEEMTELLNSWTFEEFSNLVNVGWSALEKKEATI